MVAFKFRKSKRLYILFNELSKPTLIRITASPYHPTIGTTDDLTKAAYRRYQPAYICASSYPPDNKDNARCQVP